MKIASKDLRQRAVEAYQSGEFTREEVAKMCGYTTTTAIGNWMRSFKQEGRITSLPRGHRASAFTPAEQHQLRELVEKQPDMTLEEIRAHFGKNCSLPTVSNTLARLDWGSRSKKDVKSQ